MKFPGIPRTADGYLDDGGIRTALAFGTAVYVLFLWQLIEAARSVRDRGFVATQLVRRLPALPASRSR